MLFCGYLTAQDFHITGTTTDLPNGTIVCLKNMDVETPIDTTYIEGNKFEFTGKINEAYNKHILILPKMARTRPAFFFVENTDITIDLRNKKYIGDAIITGGRIQNQQAELHEILSDKRRTYDSINNLMRTEKNPDLRVNFLTKRSELHFEMEAKKLDFIKSHPDYEYSAYMLDDLSLNNSNAEIQDLFDKLSDNVKQSKYGKQIANYLALSKDFKPGVPIENFSLTDVNGEKVELDSFRGKYVYLDFWGSWCGPCRAQHPGLVELYKKYKDKGFEIVSVSMDTDKTKWNKAVEKDNMTWTNLIDPAGFKGDVAVTYKIFSVPISFLIDPDGKVISRYLNGYHDLEKRFVEYFPN